MSLDTFGGVGVEFEAVAETSSFSLPTTEFEPDGAGDGSEAKAGP